MFGGGFIGADNANAEVAEYKDELLTRAAEEYLPYADGEGAAYARVASRVTRAGGLTNIFLSEAAVFGDADADIKLSAMVLDAFGERLSLASAAMVYEAEPLAAQQIFNMIEASPSSATYGDVTVDTIALAIDIYSGFFAAEAGLRRYNTRGSDSRRGAGRAFVHNPQGCFLSRMCWRNNNRRRI